VRRLKGGVWARTDWVRARETCVMGALFQE
jgi:hypothetical protein